MFLTTDAPCVVKETRSTLLVNDDNAITSNNVGDAAESQVTWVTMANEGMILDVTRPDANDNDFTIVQFTGVVGNPVNVSIRTENTVMPNKPGSKKVAKATVANVNATYRSIHYDPVPVDEADDCVFNDNFQLCKVDRKKAGSRATAIVEVP